MRGHSVITMKTIATLGPKGTFSDIATRRYVGTMNQGCQIKYFNSIKNTLKAIGSTCDYGLLPIENFSEGFVSLVLDHLVDTDLCIIGEIFLPIQFSFVSQANDISDIKRIFVQFVAKGQCSEFLDSFSDVEIVSTESNIESLEMINCKEGTNDGAVVPENSFYAEHLRIVVENINDYENNQTRFLVFSKQHCPSEKIKSVDYKTSIIVLNDDDHPGLLEKILSSLSKHHINLTAITSRPTRQLFGKYHFFMGFDGHFKDSNVAEALCEISSNYQLKILGSYPKAKIA